MEPQRVGFRTAPWEAIRGLGRRRLIAVGAIAGVLAITATTRFATVTHSTADAHSIRSPVRAATLLESAHGSMPIAMCQGKDAACRPGTGDARQAG